MIKKLFYIFIVFLFWTQVWAATYYVTQSGAGDGTTINTPDSISDLEADVFGELDGDTVCMMGAFTEQFSIPDAGSDGSVATYKGNCSGTTQASIDSSENYGIFNNNLSYVVIDGFNVVGAVLTGIYYYVGSSNSTDVSIINNSVNGQSMAEMTNHGIGVLANGAYTISNLTMYGNTAIGADGVGIKVYTQSGGEIVSMDVHHNTTSGNGQHGQAFTDLGTNSHTIHHLKSTGDGDDPANAGWMGIAVTATNVNKTSFTQVSGDVYNVTGGIGTDTAYYAYDNTNHEYLAKTAVACASLASGQWNQVGTDLCFNVGAQPPGITLRYARGRSENVTLNDITISGTIDASTTEGDGFTFDGFSSNNTINRLYSHDNQGAGFISNMGSGNTITNSVLTNNGRFGAVFLKQHDATTNKIYNCTIKDNTNAGIRTSTDVSVLEIKNNISSENDDYGCSSAAGATLTISNNIMFDNGVSNYNGACTEGANSYTTDPLLKSDYSLLSSSPGIDAGSNLGLPYNIDFYYRNQNGCGVTWDIGAISYCDGKYLNDSFGNLIIPLIDGPLRQ